jgi:hypothetical protein
MKNVRYKRIIWLCAFIFSLLFALFSMGLVMYFASKTSYVPLLISTLVATAGFILAPIFFHKFKITK